MKKYILGELVEMTKQEIADLEKLQTEYEAHRYDGMSYSDIVVMLIREQYSLDDELALHRQREIKLEEFETYNAFCEKCKEKAKEIINKKGE